MSDNGQPPHLVSYTPKSRGKVQGEPKEARRASVTKSSQIQESQIKLESGVLARLGLADLRPRRSSLPLAKWSGVQPQLPHRLSASKSTHSARHLSCMDNQKRPTSDSVDASHKLGVTTFRQHSSKPKFHSGCAMGQKAPQKIVVHA